MRCSPVRPRPPHVTGRCWTLLDGGPGPCAGGTQVCVPPHLLRLGLSWPHAFTGAPCMQHPGLVTLVHLHGRGRQLTHFRTHTHVRARTHTHTHTHTRAWSGSQSRLREALRFLLWGLGHWPHEPLTPGLSPGMGRPLASGPRLLQSPQGVCEQVVGGASTGAPLGRAPLAVPAEAWTRPEVLTSHFTWTKDHTQWLPQWPPEAAATLASARSTEQSHGLCSQAAPQADGKPGLGTPGPGRLCSGLLWPGPCSGDSPMASLSAGHKDSVVSGEGSGWSLSQRAFSSLQAGLGPGRGRVPFSGGSNTRQVGRTIGLTLGTLSPAGECASPSLCLRKETPSATPSTKRRTRMDIRFYQCFFHITW